MANAMCQINLHDWQPTIASNYLMCSRCRAVKKVGVADIVNLKATKKSIGPLYIARERKQNA
jgi:hypothetical protein